jgi:[protein-PII] uridylyltransferase
VDACLRDLFADAGPQARTALVALGGYGRGELTPQSDIDLLLLHGGRSLRGAGDAAAVKAVAERLLYPLWDGGFTVGHAVRTAKECVEMAGEHVDAATALLDARFLSGDRAVFDELRTRISEWLRRDPGAFVRRLDRAARTRAETYGSVSHLLEPELKEGSGGLRDVHTIGWVAAALEAGDVAGLEREGLLRHAERESVEEAEEFFVRVRSALHLETGKKTDRLHLDHQPWLATALGFEDEPGLTAADALMRATFEHARRVEQVRQALFERVEAPSRTADVEPGDESPEAILRAFAEMAAGARLSPAALDRIESIELPDEVTWTPAMLESFLAILRSGRAARVLEALDLSGLLVRLVPGWAAVRCRPQRDPFHRYTVDVHLSQAVEEMVRLLRGASEDRLVGRALLAVEDRDALLLGALLHDIGKIGHGDHVSNGLHVAESFLQRIGAPASTRQLVSFLVGNHLLLSDTATRRDLEDENLVLDVAAKIGDQERLAALYLLTVADSAATGPHAWTPWRATLVHDLVSKVQHVLERGDMGAEAAERLAERSDIVRRLLAGEDPAAVERFLALMPRAYLLSILPERAIRHFHLVYPRPGALEVRTQAEPGSRPGSYGLTVVAQDRPGLLSRIAGALALSGLSILSAQVFTTEDGVAVDIFDVEGAFEEAVDEDRWRRFRSTLRKAIEGRLSLEYRVKEKREFYPTPRGDLEIRVTVDNEASDFFTVIEVGGPDRIGFLFDVTRTLFELQLDVHVAKVATYGGRVVDAFYVRDVVGEKVHDPEHIEEIVRAIGARLSD